jgi:hypothetical protein
MRGVENCHFDILAFVFIWSSEKETNGNKYWFLNTSTENVWQMQNKTLNTMIVY